jgi:peptidoglycan biosynthesis protein MviN/MurJ (putative lipid II flippase)
LRKYLKPLFSKLAHNLLSLATFITGMVSLIYIWIGHSWTRRYDPDQMRYYMAWLAGIITFLTIIGALKSLKNQCFSFYQMVYESLIKRDEKHVNQC